MANQLRNENEIYETIKKESIQVHPLVWELINHHVRNDLMLLSADVAIYRLVPEKILKEASEFIVRRYKEEAQPGSPPADLKKSFDKVVAGTQNIDAFLKKLRELTLPDENGKGENKP